MWLAKGATWLRAVWLLNETDYSVLSYCNFVLFMSWSLAHVTHIICFIWVESVLQKKIAKMPFVAILWTLLSSVDSFLCITTGPFSPPDVGEEVEVSEVTQYTDPAWRGDDWTARLIQQGLSHVLEVSGEIHPPVLTLKTGTMHLTNLWCVKCTCNHGNGSATIDWGLT